MFQASQPELALKSSLKATVISLDPFRFAPNELKTMDFGHQSRTSTSFLASFWAKEGIRERSISFTTPRNA